MAMIYCICGRYFDTWETPADDSRFCSHSCEAQLWLPFPTSHAPGRPTLPERHMPTAAGSRFVNWKPGRLG